ncbi:MAG: DNA repair protein RecO [bacterium]
MTFLTSAITLKKSVWGEGDYQYTLYTKDHGKLTVMAKGAKKITSKLASHLEPFLVSQVMLAQGQLTKHLAGAQVSHNYSGIKKDLFKILSANCFLETVDLLVVRDGGEALIFNLTHNFLDCLSKSQYTQADLLILNKHLFELLKILGYEPEITASNQKRLLADLYRLIRETGEKEIKSFDFLINALRA